MLDTLDIVRTAQARDHGTRHRVRPIHIQIPSLVIRHRHSASICLQYATNGRNTVLASMRYDTEKLGKRMEQPFCFADGAQTDRRPTTDGKARPPGGSMLISQRLEKLATHRTDAAGAVARFLLEDATHAETLSMRQIAEATATSKPTLVRVAQQLGYSGWRDFFDAWRLELAMQRERMGAVNHSLPFAAGATTREIADAVARVASESAWQTAGCKTPARSSVPPSCSPRHPLSPCSASASTNYACACSSAR